MLIAARMAEMSVFLSTSPLRGTTRPPKHCKHR